VGTFAATGGVVSTVCDEVLVLELVSLACAVSLVDDLVGDSVGDFVGGNEVVDVWLEAAFDTVAKNSALMANASSIDVFL